MVGKSLKNVCSKFQVMPFRNVVVIAFIFYIFILYIYFIFLFIA